jgi:hypothetical protein
MDNKVFRNLSTMQREAVQREIQKQAQKLLKQSKNPADPFRSKFPHMHGLSQYRTGFQVIYQAMRELVNTYGRAVQSIEVWAYLLEAPNYGGRAFGIKRSTFFSYMSKGNDLGLWRSVGRDNGNLWIACTPNKKAVKATAQLFLF